MDVGGIQPPLRPRLASRVLLLPPPCVFFVMMRFEFFMIDTDSLGTT